LLGLTIGPTTYSFTLVVSTFIVGLALGNILFGWLADRVKGPFQLLVITQVCAACLALVVSQFLGNSQFFFSKLIYNFQGDFGERILVQSVVLFFVLVGPTVFLGATFPLVNRIYARSLPDIGRSIGTAYAVNTIGAILGSFVAGFILIPLLGKENGLRMTAGIQLLISVPALAYLSFRTGERFRASLTGLISLSIGLILIINFPSWDHKILSRGWYYRPDSITQYFSTTSWFEAIWEGNSKIAEQEADTDVVFYGDGIGGFTTVRKWISPTGTANYYLVNSGKTDASSHSDRLTQALSAHVPLLFHPNPEKVMILGLASGMTAGEALLYPVRQLDLLEINDQVIKAAEFFTPWNNGCLTDPKSRIIVQDGRNHLELTDEKYDVIISEPSNPWMAGLANLFTLDYFKTVKGRLNGNGIFIQWTNAYDMDWNSFSMIGRNFAEVFPNGLLIKTIGTSDFLLVGFADKKNLDLKIADKNIVYAKKSKNITIRDPRVIFNLIVTEDLKGFFGSGPLHTDNRPHLEFAAPKNIGMNIETVQERIQHNSRLSEETKEIVELNNNIDRSLDILNLMIVGPSPPFRLVDLKNISPAQQKRYQDILQDYCGNEDVADYGIFPNSDLKKECACLQVVKIREHLALNPEDRYAYYQLGLGLRAMGDADEAIDAFRQAVSLYPSYYAAYIEMGETFTSQGKFAEALDPLYEALRNSPDSAEVHNNIGNALSQLGKLSEAIDQYHKALQINPEFVDAHNNLGILYAGQGRHDEALTHYKKGLEIDPGNADCNVNTGILLVQMDQISASIDYFLEALIIDPNHFLAHYNIGIVLLNQGQIEEAADYFFKASEVNPDNPDVHRILGVILEKLGRFKEAVSHFSEALKLDPYSAETHDNLGVTLAQMGQLVEAVEHFKKALEIDSSFESAREHLEVAQREIDK
jgi:spermidine synthase